MSSDGVIFKLFFFNKVDDNIWWVKKNHSLSFVGFIQRSANYLKEWHTFKLVKWESSLVSRNDLGWHMLVCLFIEIENEWIICTEYSLPCLFP